LDDFLNGHRSTRVSNYTSEIPTASAPLGARSAGGNAV
jgi:hypothetical protein